jgi:NAD(P)-dependent dehydrogenase (short-subunit alcohol dehydrogenase family)
MRCNLSHVTYKLQISARGSGKCIPIQCDHGNENDIQRLFDRIKSEQDGRLDVLVNNAYSAVSVIISYVQILLPLQARTLVAFQENNDLSFFQYWSVSSSCATLSGWD